jgi:hypothetical protein
MFAANSNTNDFMQTWEDVYQITHYKVPAYKAIADESIKPNLEKGQVYHRTYDSDFVVEDMGGDGGYNNQAWTDSDETITINFEKDVSFYIKKLDKFQAQLPLQVKKARKAMNNLFLQLDSDVFGAAFQGAGSLVDDGVLGGTPGNAINLNVGNVMAVCSASEMNLRLNNVIYDPTAQYTGDFKLDRQNTMPVAVISAQFYNILLQFLGGKTTELGDNVSNSGYVGKYFGFNLYVSNNLPWTGQLALPVNPTAGDTITFLNGVVNKIGGTPVPQAITFTFQTTPVLAGDVVIGTTAADTIANLVNVFNAPYTLIPNTATTGYVPYAAGNLTTTQKKFFVGLSSTSNGTNILVQANGQGNVPVSQSMTAPSDIWTLTQQKQHNIFAVTKSISVVIQYGPYLEILQSNPAQNSGNSGRVGWDFVTWMAYGIKVFNDQTPQLVDVQVGSSTFTTNPVNTFN